MSGTEPSSVFHKKRHTQPRAVTHVLEGQNRGLQSAGQPGGGGQMSGLARRAFGKAGCKKEQEKQYMSYINETQRNTDAMRQRLFS